MKNRILNIFLVLAILVGTTLPAVFAYAETDIDPLNVRTKGAKDITSSTVVLEGAVDPDGMAAIAWFEWGTAIGGLDYRTNYQNIGYGERSIDFLSGLANLSSDSIYFFRAVVKNAHGTYYGSTESFKTKALSQEKSSSGGFRLFSGSKAEANESGSLLMTVNVSTDKTKVTRDEFFVLNIAYRNLGTIDADDVVLIVDLPGEFSLDVAAPLCYGVTDKDNLRFNLGRVSAGEASAVGIRVKTSSTARIGKELTIDTDLQYKDPEGSSSAKASDSLTITVSTQSSNVAAVGAISFTGSALLWFVTSLLLTVGLIGHIYYSRKKIKILLNGDE